MRSAPTDLPRDEGEGLDFGWKNLFVTLWREVFTLMRANLCFLLFCLPVVTIPPALCALYTVCVDAIRGRRCRVMRIFLDTIKKQFLPSWGVMLCFVLAEAVCIYGAYAYFIRVSSFAGFAVLGLLPAMGAVVGLLMLPYCLCMVGRVELPFLKILKNSFLLVFLNLKYSVCSGVLALVLLLAQVQFWAYLIPLILLIGIALTVYFGAYFSLYGLQRFVLTEPL